MNSSKDHHEKLKELKNCLNELNFKDTSHLSEDERNKVINANRELELKIQNLLGFNTDYEHGASYGCYYVDRPNAVNTLLKCCIVGNSEDPDVDKQTCYKVYELLWRDFFKSRQNRLQVLGINFTDIDQEAFFGALGFLYTNSVFIQKHSLENSSDIHKNLLIILKDLRLQNGLSENTESIELKKDIKRNSILVNLNSIEKEVFSGVKRHFALLVSCMTSNLCSRDTELFCYNEIRIFSENVFNAEFFENLSSSSDEQYFRTRSFCRKLRSIAQGSATSDVAGGLATVFITSLSEILGTPAAVTAGLAVFGTSTVQRLASSSQEVNLIRLWSETKKQQEYVDATTLLQLHQSLCTSFQKICAENRNLDKITQKDFKEYEELYRFFESLANRVKTIDEDEIALIQAYKLVKCNVFLTRKEESAKILRAFRHFSEESKQLLFAFISETTAFDSVLQVVHRRTALKGSIDNFKELLQNLSATKHANCGYHLEDPIKRLERTLEQPSLTQKQTPAQLKLSGRKPRAT